MDGWGALDRELDLWADAGTPVRFWWRDDDAVAPTPALEELIALSERYGAPAHLAVVPRDAEPALANRLAATPEAWVLQHGYCHKNHEPKGERASEIGRFRPLEPQIDDLRRGRDRLTTLGFARALPGLVPPWNRIGPKTVSVLPSLGFRLLSTYGPLSEDTPVVPGLMQINGHIDPMRWRNGPEFRGEQKILRHLLELLVERREAGVAPDMPFGIVSHHLVTSQETWDFLDKLFEVVTEHPGGAWLRLNDLLEAADHG